jgi:hypothetical protein
MEEQILFMVSPIRYVIMINVCVLMAISLSRSVDV